MKLHKCHGGKFGPGRYGQNNWPMCCVCDGRIHDNDCTSKMRKEIDCCPARHKMLHDEGKVRGLFDESYMMWSEEFPQGYHNPERKS